MQVTVIIRPTPEEVARLTFDAGQRIVFGRGPGCDVRLPDTSVSHRHAYLCAESGEFLLFDEGSTNGTLVGGVRIAARASRIVRSGDVIRMGRMSVELLMESVPVTRDVAASTRDLALLILERELGAAGADTATAIRVVEGADRGQCVRLSEGSSGCTIGRGQECDFVLADVDASREHARIYLQGDVVTVRDLGSKNGTWVGAVRIASDDDVVWRGPAMMRVGKTVLALDRPVHEALARIERAQDDRIELEEKVTLNSISQAAATPLPVPVPLGKPSRTVDGAIQPSTSRIPRMTAPPSHGAPSRWVVFETMVIIASVVVLVLSLAGLVWLLHG
jgi:pSer/pThr/pTyr-binding forkhead associated (FHA) protein